jgi:DNA (cytosine-5)-methyltransferase 1
MRKDYIGTVNIEGTWDFIKFTKGLCKTLKAETHDISVVEVINLSERIDTVNEPNTIAKQASKQASKQVEVIGCMDHTMDSTFESANRVYDCSGVCPTIPTCGGGNIQPKFLEVKKVGVRECECIGGFGEKKSNGDTQYYQQDRVYSMGDVAMCIPSQLPGGSYNYLDQQIVAMRGRNPENPSDRTPGIETEQKYHNFLYEIDGELYLIRIRKLIPRECWRLMSFTDEDFDKAASVNSNTQLYKQAGNSIVKDVMMAIFRQML